MENIFIEVMPPWVETGLQPAFYDKESGTVLQQSSRMYAKVNEIVAGHNTLVKDFSDLYDYVHDYFDNLDVSTEINEKLNSMAESGELGEYYEQYVKPTLDAQDAKIEAQNANIATSINNQNALINSRLNSQDTTINNSINTQNAQISIINNKVERATSGSPKGAYATLADLQTANPDHDYIYVVKADNHWYYWANNQWNDGGLYQTAVIGNGTITRAMLETQLQQGIVIEDGTPAPVLITGQKYTGGPGSTIGTSVVSSMSSGYATLTDRDIVYVPFVNPMYFDGSYLIFCDNSDVVLKTYSIYDVMEEIEGTWYPKPTVIVPPAGTAKLYFNVRNVDPNFAGGNVSVGLPFIVTKYNYQDKRVNNLANSYSSIDYAEIIAGKIFSYRLFNYDLGVFNTYAYNVEEFTNISLKTKIYNAVYLCAGIFVDDNDKIVGYLKPTGNSSSEQDVEITDALVPAMATKLYVTVYQSYDAPEVKKKIITADEYTNVKATISDGKLKLEGLNQEIDFEHYGGNNLFMIKKISTPSGLQTLYTDMTPAPYIVNAVNNANGDRTEEGFTGGNHQWNNQGSGSTATAEEITLKFFADNTEVAVNADSVQRCNNFKIVEVNRIQANNTCLEAGGGRNVIEETIVFEYDGEELKVNNTIEALEDVKIKRYYGIQLVASDAGYTFYGQTKITNASGVTEKPYAIVGSNLLSGKMEDTGIGNYSLAGNHKAIVYSNKAYYTPIYDNNSTLSLGEKYFMKGSYKVNTKLV